MPWEGNQVTVSSHSQPHPSLIAGRAGQQAGAEWPLLGPAHLPLDQCFICWFPPAGTAAPSQEARSLGAGPLPPPQSLAAVPLFTPQTPVARPSTLLPPASVASLAEIGALATQLAALPHHRQRASCPSSCPQLSPLFQLKWLRK